MRLLRLVGAPVWVLVRDTATGMLGCFIAGAAIGAAAVRARRER